MFNFVILVYGMILMMNWFGFLLFFMEIGFSPATEKLYLCQHISCFFGKGKWVCFVFYSFVEKCFQFIYIILFSSSVLIAEVKLCLLFSRLLKMGLSQISLEFLLLLRNRVWLSLSLLHYFHLQALSRPLTIVLGNGLFANDF